MTTVSEPIDVELYNLLTIRKTGDDQYSAQLDCEMIPVLVFLFLLNNLQPDQPSESSTGSEPSDPLDRLELEESQERISNSVAARNEAATLVAAEFLESVYESDGRAELLSSADLKSLAMWFNARYHQCHSADGADVRGWIEDPSSANEALQAAGLVATTLAAELLAGV